MNDGPRRMLNPDLTFDAFLRIALDEGVRPGIAGPIAHGWKHTAFAEKCGVSEKTVGNWVSGRRFPDHPKTIERILFGNNDQDGNLLRSSFWNSLRNSRESERKQISYYKYPTVYSFWSSILAELKIQIDDYQHINAENIQNASWIITQIDPKIDRNDALNLAHSMREKIFDAKYGNWTEKEDERYDFGIGDCNDELEQILKKYHIKYNEKAIICGIGCGLEGDGVYQNFENLICLDISKSAVEKSQMIFPNSQCIKGRSEDLPPIADQISTYISLKTLSSSFFDIDSAILSCSQKMVSGGTFICSIPKGYGYGQKRFTAGISRTNYNFDEKSGFINYFQPDTSYPYDLLKKICGSLYKRIFESVEVHSGCTEHYIIARRK